jgi:hypothetical protein
MSQLHLRRLTGHQIGLWPYVIWQIHFTISTKQLSSPGKKTTICPIPVNIRPIFSNRPRPRVLSFLIQRHNMIPERQSGVESYFLWKMNILLAVNVTDLPRYTMCYELINQLPRLMLPCLFTDVSIVIPYKQLLFLNTDLNHLACQPLTQGRILIISVL